VKHLDANKKGKQDLIFVSLLTWRRTISLCVHQMSPTDRVAAFFSQCYRQTGSTRPGSLRVPTWSSPPREGGWAATADAAAQILRVHTALLPAAAGCEGFRGLCTRRSLPGLHSGFVSVRASVPAQATAAQPGAADQAAYELQQRREGKHLVKSVGRQQWLLAVGMQHRASHRTRATADSYNCAVPCLRCTVTWKRKSRMLAQITERL